MRIFKFFHAGIFPGFEPIRQIARSFKVHPFTALLGPRQCGKTTLAKYITKHEPQVFLDLENPIDIQGLTAPIQALKNLSGLVILDEIQTKPELFELLRILVDRPDQDARFLIFGSASPGMIKGVSESLAGRIGFIYLCGFKLW